MNDSVSQSIGTSLRVQRELRGISAAELSRVTRIPRAAIEAIETDRFDELPGEVFVRGFLRAYAQAVGLLPADILARFTSSRRVVYVTPLPTQTPLQAAREGQGRRFGVAIAFVLLLILLSLALSIVLKPRGHDMPPELSMRAASVCAMLGGVILLDTQALVVRTVEFGESDIIATLITEQAGKVSTAVRGARKSCRRTGGALEPLHTIAVRIEDRGKELTTLKEARVVRVRAALASNLDALEAAGVALRWARHLFPPRTVEPEGWRVLIELLDALDATATAPAPAPAPESAPAPASASATTPTSALSSRRELAKAGLAMLTAVGYGLDFDRCVACGRECPPGKAACIDPARGGLICRTCGGAPTVLLPEARDVARAFARGAASDVSSKDAESLLGLVTRAMAAHTGFDR